MIWVCDRSTIMPRGMVGTWGGRVRALLALSPSYIGCRGCAVTGEKVGAVIGVNSWRKSLVNEGVDEIIRLSRSLLAGR